MQILVIVWLALTLTQFLIGLYALYKRSRFFQSYSFPLSSQKEGADSLETYSRVFRSVNIRVHQSIKYPAKAYNEFVVINKEKIYHFDLFTNYYLIYQLELSEDKNWILRNQERILLFIFSFGLLAFLVGIYLNSSLGNIFLLVSIIIQTVTIILSYLLQEFKVKFLGKVHKTAKDLLDFDELEELRALKLKNDLSLSIYEYPIKTISNFVLFFVPGRPK